MVVGLGVETENVPKLDQGGIFGSGEY